MNQKRFEIPEQIVFTENFKELINTISISETNWEIDTVLIDLLATNNIIEINSDDKNNLLALIMYLWKLRIRNRINLIIQKCSVESSSFDRRAISRGAYYLRTGKEYNPKFIELLENILTNVSDTLVNIFSNSEELNSEIQRIKRYEKSLKIMKSRSSRHNQISSSKRFVNSKNNEIFPFVLLIKLYQKIV